MTLLPPYPGFICAFLSATPKHEEHHRQHRPVSDATRNRRFSRSARRAKHPPATKSVTYSGSKALQWAKAVGAKTSTSVGRCSVRHPRSASCPPRRQIGGSGTAGSLGGGGTGRAVTNVQGELGEGEGRRGCGSCSTAENGRPGVGSTDPSQANRGSRLGNADGQAEYVGGRGQLGLGDCARTNESRDMGGGSSVDTGPHGDSFSGGYWRSTEGVAGDVNGYSTDGDGYSDDSFAPDGDNDGVRRSHEEPCKLDGCHSELRASVGGYRFDFERDTAVDAIPSTLVETGRGADG